jgi:hypothetical protein
MHTVLGDLDRAVRARFERELRERGADGVAVSFDAPTGAWAEALERPALNLYLYDVQESRDERRVEWDEARVDGRPVARPPPVRLDVSYVITAWASTSEDEHGLLSAALAIAYAHPALPDDVRTGVLAEDDAAAHELTVRAARPPGDGHSAAFWAALGAGHKASVDFGVGVWCRPGRAREQAPPVRTQTLRMEVRARPAAGVEELHRISGTVRGADGEPSEGAWVVLPESGGLAVTDPQGRFTLAALRAGRHALKVRGTTGAEADATAAVPGAPVDVTLP